MKIKKANMKRLASLSAVGVGALGMASGTAEANNILYSGVLNEKVGFSAGFGRSATILGPGAEGIVKRIFSEQSNATIWAESLHAGRGLDGTEFRFLAQKPRGTYTFRSFAEAFPLGAKWSTASIRAAPASMHARACATEGRTNPNGRPVARAPAAHLLQRAGAWR
jgi:hypothetical protein